MAFEHLFCHDSCFYHGLIILELLPDPFTSQAEAFSHLGAVLGPTISLKRVAVTPGIGMRIA